MTEFSVLMSIYYKEVPSNFRESLDSIIAQSYKPSDIILVEDGPLTKDLYAVIEEYKKDTYYKNVAVVNQESFLFNMSIKDNLKMACKDEKKTN